MSVLYLILLCTLQIPIFSSKINRIQNEMIGDPHVICDIRHIRITIKTLSEFNGNLYSKGYFHKPDCRIRGNSLNNTVDLILPVDSDCGIRRKRMINPRGILLDTTIVLMFHPVFLTQTDRSYHIQCQYSETDRTVTNALDVSMQPASDLPQRANLQDSEDAPVCKYEVLMGSDSGPPLSHATVGDAVYHKWSCDGSNKDAYCMTVHSCIVDDGQGFGQKLVDEHGCSLDSFILKEIEYKDHLEAGQISNVFKFADKPTVFFSCMIRVEMKENEQEACKPANEICSMKSIRGANHSIRTESRVSDEIPPGFPYPPNSTINEKNEEREFSDFDNDEESWASDETDRINREAKKVPPATMNRLIRRDVGHRILADVDVSAPSVDVMDIPDIDVTKPNKITTDNKLLFKNKSDICISRFSIIISLLILIISSLISIVFLYIIMSRLTHKDSRNRKTMLPHPDLNH